MKKILTFLYCICGVCAFAQEKLNTFHIIDNETNKPIPATAITIVRAKLSITTEKDGIFIIPGDLTKMRDSVIFYAQNYAVLKMSLPKLNGVDNIRLTKLSAKPSLALSSYQTDTLLNNFNSDDIGYYAGLHSETALFEYLQLAQQFVIQKAGARLKSITVNRLSFKVKYQLDLDRAYKPELDLTGLEHTKFRLHVYDVDDRTGSPSNDLCNKIIEVTSRDSKRISVDLKSYNIIIPGKIFFIAIEWLRDYYNAGYSMVFDEKTGKQIQVVNYRPTLGISPVTGKKLNIWGLDLKHEWKPYTYFSPFGTDLAIKTTIEY